MRFEKVLPARQTDANREFEVPAGQSRLAIVVLIALTIIALLSLRFWS
jgi:hypothetical protein